MSENVSRFCETYKISDHDCFQITLVLDELLTNIISYANASCDIEVYAKFESDTVSISIIDDGLFYNPLTETKTPDLDTSLEDRQIGGLGVHITKTMMNRVDYKRLNEKNSLTLIKKIEVQP